jgi:hypothetical protein
MGAVFWLFSYFSASLAILLLALCLASGLYLLTEVTEEFPTLTGKVMNYLLITVTVLQVILWLDGLPTMESVVQLISLGLNFMMLKDFPFCEFLSIQTIGSILFFLLTNLLWLRYFVFHIYGPVAIIGFFITNVWIVPCGLFITLSINDNTLPGMIGQSNRDNGLNNLSTGGRHRSIFRALFDYCYSEINKVGGVLNPMKLLQDKRK